MDNTSYPRLYDPRFRLGTLREREARAYDKRAQKDVRIREHQKKHETPVYNLRLKTKILICQVFCSVLTAAIRHKMSFSLFKTGEQWSHSRSSVPPALSQAGVPEETWLATFDETVDRNKRFSLVLKKITAAKAKRSRVHGLICFFLFLSFIVAAIFIHPMFILIGLSTTFFAWCFLTASRIEEFRGERSEHRRAWGHFVEEQQVVYRPYGIQVEMFKALTPDGGKTKKLIIGGLMFKLAESSTPTQTRTFVQELESLYQLHQSGGLSLEEYSEAKTKLIHNTPQISSTNVAIAEVLSQDEDSMSPNGHGLGENQAAKVKPFEIV